MCLKRLRIFFLEPKTTFCHSTGATFDMVIQISLSTKRFFTMFTLKGFHMNVVVIFQTGFLSELSTAEVTIEGFVFGMDYFMNWYISWRSERKKNCFLKWNFQWNTCFYHQVDAKITLNDFSQVKIIIKPIFTFTPFKT